MNLGFEFNFRSARYDAANSSQFDVLKFEDLPTVRTALTNVGFKVRYTPSNNWRNITMQTSIFTPVTDSLEGYASNNWTFLDLDKILVQHQIFYIKMLGSKTQLFSELNWMNHLYYNADPELFGLIQFSAKAFLSHFVNNKTTVYMMGDYNPTVYGMWGKMHFSQLGAGAKYNLFKGFEVEILYAKFVEGSPGNGAGHSLNLGLRYFP